MQKVIGVWLAWQCLFGAAHAETLNSQERYPPEVTLEEVDALTIIPSVQHGISYVAGGVGVVERKALEQWARSYTLRVDMAGKDGAYLANMRVRVFDSHGGQILDVSSDGPLLFAMLPEGRYRVLVEGVDAQRYPLKQREVWLTDGKQARVFFAW